MRTLACLHAVIHDGGLSRYVHQPYTAPPRVSVKQKMQACDMPHSISCDAWSTKVSILHQHVHVLYRTCAVHVLANATESPGLAHQYQQLLNLVYEQVLSL